MHKSKRSGTVLLLLITTIFLVLTLAGVVSWLILNQSRVNQHQIERVRAYYEAMGGIAIAFDRIRGGDWGNSTFYVCRYILAPHPFYPKRFCLSDMLYKNIDLFDGIEYSHYYNRHFNMYNKKAEAAAKKYNKPMIGTSDAHQFLQFDNTYTFIDSKKDVSSVIKAMKQGKVKLKTNPFSYIDCARIIIPMSLKHLRNLFRGKRANNLSNKS